MSRCPMSATVVFADGVATTTTDPVVATGVVNGEPIEGPDGALYVPVWAQRDNGREPTTVYVAEANVLKVGS
jgi:hypothetical protein